jgi:hypothetical protein
MTAKEVRIELGADILIAMLPHDEFPVANVHRLARTMQEYFESEGFEDTLVELGSKWRPTEDYWVRHLSEIRAYLRDVKKMFLEYNRESNGTFVGKWEFVRKGAFEAVMNKELTGLETRIENYNERIDDGRERWKLQVPGLRVAQIEQAV